MNAKAQVVPFPSPSLDPIAGLRAERERIVAALGDADRKLTRLSEAEAGERAAFDTIGALGAAEIQAVKLWAASGCEGAQPRPDSAERQRLADALADATRANAAAKAAAADVEAQAVPLRKRICEIDAELRLGALEKIGGEHAAHVVEFAEIVGKLKDILTEVRAAPEAVQRLGETARTRGDDAFMRACFTLAARMRETRLAEPEPSLAEVSAAAEQWRAKLAAAGLQ